MVDLLQLPHGAPRSQVMRRQAQAMKDAQDNLQVATAVILAFVRNPAAFEQRLMAQILAERFRRESIAAAVAAEHAEAALEYAVLRSRAEASTAAAVTACISRHTATALAQRSARTACVAAAQSAYAEHARVVCGFHAGSAAIAAAQSVKAGMLRRTLQGRKLHAGVARVTAARAAEQWRQRDGEARRAAVQRVQLCAALAARVTLRTGRRVNARRGMLAKQQCRAVPMASLQVYLHGQAVFAKAHAAGIASVAASSRAAAVAAADTAAAARARGQAVFSSVLDDRCRRAAEVSEPASVQPSRSGDSGSELRGPPYASSEEAGRGADARPSATLLLRPVADVDSASGDDAPAAAVGMMDLRPQALLASPAATGSGASCAGHTSEAAVETARARSASAAPLQTIHRIISSPRDDGGHQAAVITETRVLQGVTFAEMRTSGDGEDDGGSAAMAARRPWKSCAAEASLQRAVAEVRRSLRSSPGSAALRLWEPVLGNVAARESVKHTDRQVRNRNAPRARVADVEAEADAVELEAPAAVAQDRLPAAHRVPVPTGVGALVEATRTMRAPAMAELSQRAAEQHAQTLRRVSFGGALSAAEAGAAAPDEDAALESLMRPVSARRHGRDQGGHTESGRGGDV